MARIVLHCASVICAFAAATLWAGPYVARADLYEDDAAQHTFWLYRYADPSLFPHDPTAAFFSLPSSAPWGYRSLYALLAPHFDALTAAEWLAPLLFLVACAYAWGIGRRVAAAGHEALGGLVAVAAVGWLVAQHADAMTPLGLQRTFALPIVLLFLWGAIARRWAWIGASWLLAAFFYPVIVVVLGLAGGIVLLRETWRARALPPYASWNVLAGCVALAIVLANSSVPADVGPTVGREALTMPEFGLDGRLRLYGATFMGTWFRNQLVGVGWSAATLLTVAGATAVACLPPRPARIPHAAWTLLLVGLATWAVALAVPFELYLPNRHARWAIAGFAIVALVAGATAVSARLTTPRGVLARHPVPVAIGAAVASLAIVAATLLPGTVRAWTAPSGADLERAYAYLRTLPHGTLVAAHPDVADFVPLRAHLPVLASTETSLPFMQGYYRRLEPRLEASLRAAYATNWGDLDRALAPWGVDVMLTAPAAWTREGYYAPFDGLVDALRARGVREGFVLRHPRGPRVLFRSGEVYVVRVQRAPGAGVGAGAPPAGHIDVASGSAAR